MNEISRIWVIHLSRNPFPAIELVKNCPLISSLLISKLANFQLFNCASFDNLTITNRFPASNNPRKYISLFPDFSRTRPGTRCINVSGDSGDSGAYPYTRDSGVSGASGRLCNGSQPQSELLGIQIKGFVLIINLTS